MALSNQSRMSFPADYHQRLHAYLLQHGLIGVHKKYSDRSATEKSEPGRSSLRVTLQELGELTSLWGLYLSTRIDLFSVDDCMELRRIPDSARPLPFVEVQEFVAQELGVGIERAFLAVEPMPFETHLLHDSYIVMLQNGESAILRVLRPEFRSFPAEHVDALRLLGESRLFRHWAETIISEAVDEFTRELRRMTDQLQEAAAFEALALDAEVGDGLWAPKTLREFCRSAVLTLGWRPLVKLGSVTCGKGLSDPAVAVHEAAMSANKGARLICHAWVRQVFHGRVFPIQFGLGDVGFSEDGQVAFLGRVFTTLSEDSKASTWRYLVAVASDEPDESCRSLLALMHGGKKRETSEELLASFRQAVSCFMSEPGERDCCSGLAARIVRQLQLATQAGYSPTTPLISFYRGFFSVLAVIHSLQPQGDPFLEAVESVWMIDIFSSVRRTVGTGSFGDFSSNWVAAILQFPVRLEAMLSQTIRGEWDKSLERVTAARREADLSSSISTVLIMTAVLLIVRNCPMHLSPTWIDRFSFVVCFLIGLLVLRMAAHS